jgi:hypothetical protein
MLAKNSGRIRFDPSNLGGNVMVMGLPSYRDKEIDEAVVSEKI